MTDDHVHEQPEVPPEPDMGAVPPTPAPAEVDERKLVVGCREEGDGLVCRITPDAKRRLDAGLVDSITLRVIREPEPIPYPSQPSPQQADGTDDEA